MSTDGSGWQSHSKLVICYVYSSFKTLSCSWSCLMLMISLEEEGEKGGGEEKEGEDDDDVMRFNS